MLTHFCNTHGLATAEAIEQRIDLRKQLAHRYLEDLSHLFYGTELNPFACYLAEMNLLIQGLDDLVVLQQSDDTQPIERFQIYNTDSLDLPREVLESANITGTMNTIFVPDRLSDRLTDDAYPLKAKLDDYAEGFFYIISNPPYVNSRQELMDVSRFKNAEFYRSVLSGDTNLYLLFLRLGLYYLADYGQMIYIVPLTIFGDRSASAARKLLKTPPFSPDIVTRFYRGDVLFPGVDQAVGIVRVRHSQPSATISVSGGDTLQDAKNTQFQTDAASVIEAVPQNGIWQGNWLVAQSQVSLDIWAHVKQKSGNFSARLGNLLDATFETRQGDVNATLINPLRIQNGSFAKGNIAIYKGEDVEPYAPLPAEPSDWVDATSASENVTIIRSRQILERLKQAKEGEQGIVLRQVARLNTREYLKASWFERTANTPTAFTNELWRMLVKPEISENNAKSLLAFLNSKVIIYLINLFSTNNHVSKDELDRVPIPSVQPMPIAQLSRLADELLSERVSLERDFVRTYNARLPDSDSDSDVYIPPSAVLASTRLPRITLMGLVGRGAVKNMGPATGRIRSLRTRNLIVSTLPSTDTNAISFDHVLMLFLSEQAREDDTWGQAQNWQLPDPVASGAWLQIYNATVQQAQAKWERFMTLQLEVDALVADWYGFNTEMRAAIAEDLPWARRRKNA